MRQFLVFWSTEGSGAQRPEVGLTPPSGSMNFAHFEHFVPQRAQNVQNPQAPGRLCPLTAIICSLNAKPLQSQGLFCGENQRAEFGADDMAFSKAEIGRVGIIII